MNIKEKVKSTVGDILDDLIEAEIDKWPPDCSAFLYQPERPNQNTENE